LRIIDLQCPTVKEKLLAGEKWAYAQADRMDPLKLSPKSILDVPLPKIP
jgi:hypothetical protein